MSYELCLELMLSHALMAWFMTKVYVPIEIGKNGETHIHTCDRLVYI